MPQSSSDVGVTAFPTHLRTPLQVRGPLKRITAISTFPASLKAPMNIFAALISAFQPVFPRLPLPSMSRMTSRVVLHAIGRVDCATSHLCKAHSLYSNLLTDHSPGHFPCPSASTRINFWRLCVPPSQSLEQVLHAVQSVSSQSFSHAQPLQETVSDVVPQGWPPYFIATFTSRKRCLTPPPHGALHLLHPVHASNLQSTGHGWLLQLLIANSGKHFAPPSVPSGCTRTLRVSFCSPPSHDLVHSSGLHLLTSQS
mmetsp:Transcript_75964/g.120014  ORF Transcript_75964/g.120014 Transcript_75964/m.120014 type:complete len:255 (-) Transcript_75964:933-1697(-)